MDVKVYKTEGLDMDMREMSLNELPPIPEGFNEELAEAGGWCDGKPNVKVVSGMDPELTEFYGDRWWRKYAFRENRVHHYAIWNKPDGEKKIISPAEAEVLQKAKNLKGIIIPVVDRQTIEHGIPRYFVEYYKPPELFGDPEAWEAERWLEAEDGRKVDLMGAFPSEGWYETWFMVEDVITDEAGEVTGTKLRLLDDVVLEFIKAKIEESRQFSASDEHTRRREVVNKEYLKHKEEMKNNIADIVRDHAHRLVE